MPDLVRTSPPTPPRTPVGRQGYLVRGTIPPVFVERSALAPEHAIDFAPAAAQAREWARLREDGAIRAAGQRWWLDIVAYRTVADARSRALAPWLIAGAVAIAAVAVLFYRG